MLLLLSTCLLGLVLLVVLLLLLLHTSRANAAGSQSHSSSSMAMAAAVSVEGESQTLGEEEGEKPSSGGGEGWTVVGSGKFDHPIYKRLSALNGELNSLPLRKVEAKLSGLNLSSMYVSTCTAVLLITQCHNISFVGSSVMNSTSSLCFFAPISEERRWCFVSDSSNT